MPGGTQRAWCALLLAAAAVAGGCGQRGPLALPDSAQPVQRVNPSPPGSAPAAEPSDEENRENER